ncbi:hypothetical protein LO763_22025 [Glycomyces sp. A-F 0318]|uniref:hypothetical protein n=1 Tax=Glycomyces amatae TaxID=2881355 RepID=UPI001E4ED546|nr:hypothetical protein [Glycomyces amatae]MCD0446295.1 hypothetical protein [Glycomyces amatae]
MTSIDSVHYEDGPYCGRCANAWPCQGYNTDYQQAMHERNAAQDQQWAPARTAITNAVNRGHAVS